MISSRLKPDTVPASPVAKAGFNEDWYSETQLRLLGKVCRKIRGLHGAVVEIGCWEGRSTATLANCCFPDTVLAVDTWAGNICEGPQHPSVIAAAERNVFATFTSNIRAFTKGNVEPFIMDSNQFLSRLKAPVKFCHIDASHDYESVAKEIQAVLQLLVPGGILCGDDFMTAHKGRADLKGGVERAVRELLPSFHSSGNFWW
jgi:hypothetical protein